MNQALLNQIEQLHAKTLHTTIDLLNQKEFWKSRALMLAKKSQLCFRCGENKDWDLATLQCSQCGKEGLKELKHA